MVGLWDDPAFVSSMRIPIGMGLIAASILGVQYFNDYNISLFSKGSFENWISLFKIPITIMGLSAPAATVVANINKSTAQIKQQAKSDFFSYVSYFEKKHAEEIVIAKEEEVGGARLMPTSTNLFNAILEKDKSYNFSIKYNAYTVMEQVTLLHYMYLLFPLDEPKSEKANFFRKMALRKIFILIKLMFRNRMLSMGGFANVYEVKFVDLLTSVARVTNIILDIVRAMDFDEKYSDFNFEISNLIFDAYTNILKINSGATYEEFSKAMEVLVADPKLGYEESRIFDDNINNEIIALYKPMSGMEAENFEIEKLHRWGSYLIYDLNNKSNQRNIGSIVLANGYTIVNTEYSSDML